MAFVLIHSPLVGPTTWDGVAAELRRAGHVVSVPSLSSALATGPAFSGGFARLVAAGAPPDAWLVGHSGAGQILPLAAQLCESAGLIYVDAGLPNPGRSRLDTMPSDLVDQLNSMVDGEGYLPPWPEWFGREVLNALIEDDVLLDTFIADCPRLPMEIFTEPMPDTVEPDIPSAYVLLSEAYEEDARIAVSRGWSTKSLGGHHLWPIDHPRQTAAAILAVAG